MLRASNLARAKAVVRVRLDADRSAVQKMILVKVRREVGRGREVDVVAVLEYNSNLSKDTHVHGEGKVTWERLFIGREIWGTFFFFPFVLLFLVLVLPLWSMG